MSPLRQEHLIRALTGTRGMLGFWAIVISLVGTFLVCGIFSGEPRCEGVPLRTWLRTQSNGTYADKLRVDVEIRRLGVHAIPTLIAMLTREDSYIEVMLGSIAQRQHIIKYNVAIYERDNAIAAYVITSRLGHATESLYQLDFLLVASLRDEKSDADTLVFVIETLAALHRLPQSNHGSIPFVRFSRTNDDYEYVVKRLTDLIRDPNDNIRDAAISGLKELDPPAAKRLRLKVTPTELGVSFESRKARA